MTKLPAKPVIKIRVVKFRTHVHATESIDKVIDALETFLPESIERFYNKELKKHSLSSIYKTPIKAIEINIKKQSRIKTILKHIADNLEGIDRDKLAQGFDNRINDKNRVFFRFDKQLLHTGKIKITRGSDTVQIMVAPINKNPKADFTHSHIKNLFKDLNLI